MKQYKLIIFIVCFLGVFVPELSLIAQDSFRPKDIDISILIPEPKSVPSPQKNIVKENIDKKQKPELYTDFKREMGWFVGVNKIDQGIASHRQINYRLSEKNTAGHWTKIEIVDADLNLKKNAGYYLLRPFEDSFKDWALYPLRLNDISSIDLEYDPKGEIVIRETAKDANGDVVYIGGYKYSVDPSIDQTVMSVTYTKFDDAALFKYKETKASTIRYTYKGDTLQALELIDLDGKPLEMGWDIFPFVYDSIVKRDKYYRIDSIMYYYNEKKYESRDSVHKKEYRYDDKGNTIYEKWTNSAGDVRYFYEKTPKYIKKQSLDGIISVDSLDSHGNITWSYHLRDGKLLTFKDGYNLRHSIYDYYDPKHPESYRVTTKYYLQRYGLHKYKRYIPAGTDSLGAPITVAVADSIPEKYEDILYQIEEDRNLKDSTYTFKIYNDKGLYVGGHDFQSFFPEFDLRYPKQLYLEYCDLVSGVSNGISPNGTPLISTNGTPNAMIVVTTGERARRLGLKDNDIIAWWSGWHYLLEDDTIPDLNQLWLIPILRAHEIKPIQVLRQEADSMSLIRLYLPKGTMEELQFTLLPAEVPYSTKLILNSVYSDDYHGNNYVMMGIPQNPYTHKPIIIYAAGHHPTMDYRKKRPDPMHEWGYKNNYGTYTNNLSALPEGEKVSAYFTSDLQSVEWGENLQQDYTFVRVPLRNHDKEDVFGPYENWYKSYSELEREEIELPLLEPNKDYSGYDPNEVMNNTICYGNKNGYDLWYKRKPSDNAPIKNKNGYYKSHWKEWEMKYLKGAKKTYIIPLDYFNEQQTLKFLECLSEINLQKYYSYATWVIAETNYKNDYYVLIQPQEKDEKSISNAKNGKVGKGSKIFIYDRYNRIAAYIER